MAWLMTSAEYWTRNALVEHMYEQKGRLLAVCRWTFACGDGDGARSRAATPRGAPVTDAQ